MRPVQLVLGLGVLLLGAAVVFLLRSDEGGGRAASGPEIASPPRAQPATPAETIAPPDRPGTDAARSERTGVGAPATAGASQDERVSSPRALGSVLDESGAPVAGARVLVTRNDRRTEFKLDSARFATRYRQRLFETTTDGEGRFAVEGPRPGLLRVAVRADGFAPYDRDDFELPAQAEVELGDIVLTAGVVLAGRVVDPGGVGVAGAELFSIPVAHTFVGDRSLRETGSSVGRTDAEGRFVAQHMAPGPWKLLVTSASHPDHVAQGVVEQAPARIDGLEIRLAPGLRLAGRILGSVPDGVTVRATPVGVLVSDDEGTSSDYREVSVSRSGAFDFGGLVSGWTYEVAARQAEFESGRPIWLSPPVLARPGDPPLELTLRAAASLSLRVVDAGTGDALESYNVWLASELVERTWRRRLESGDDFELDPETGRATLEGVQTTGDATGLEIRAGGYYFERREGLRVAPGASVDLGTIALTPLPVIRASVRSALDGEPIAGATVHVANLYRDDERLGNDPSTGAHTRAPSRTTTVTDEEGLALAPGPEGATLYIWATHDAYAPSPPETLILNGLGGAAVQLRLSRGATVVAVVRDAERRPMAGRPVQRNEFRDEIDGGSWQGAGGQTMLTTDAEGRARFELLRPGKHRFAVVPPRRGHTEREWAELRIDEGEERELALDAPSLFTLSGRVAEAGFPLAGAVVWLHPGHERSWRLTLLGPRAKDPVARTGADGRYEIRDVPTGDHLLIVTHPTRAMDEEVQLGFERPGTYAWDVELPITRISGRVSDPNGTPLEGIEVAVMPSEAASGLRDAVLGRGERAALSSELERTTVTNSAGRFEARGVAAERELIVVVRGRHVRTERSEPFAVEVDGVLDGIEIVARPAGTLRVEVTNADGTPAPNVTVHASFQGRGRKDAEVQHVRTDADGRVLLDGLTPGPWRVRVAPDGQAEEEEPLEPKMAEVEAGLRSDLAFRLP